MRLLLDMPVLLRFILVVESLLSVELDPLFMLPLVPLLVVPLFIVPVVPVLPCCVMVPLLEPVVPLFMVPVVPAVPC